MNDHCPEGHEYAKRRSNGWRECAPCIYKNRKARQDKVAALAVRNYLPWEPWEIALVLGREHSVRETALMIGRTMVAVEKYRRWIERRAA